MDDFIRAMSESLYESLNRRLAAMVEEAWGLAGNSADWAVAIRRLAHIDRRYHPAEAELERAIYQRAFTLHFEALKGLLTEIAGVGDEEREMAELLLQPLSETTEAIEKVYLDEAAIRVREWHGAV